MAKSIKKRQSSVRGNRSNQLKNKKILDKNREIIKKIENEISL